MLDFLLQAGYVIYTRICQVNRNVRKTTIEKDRG
jgi:hypothetical protein